MKLSRLVAGLAALAVVAATSAAIAAPNAEATGDFELRKAPSSNSAKVNYVEDGDMLTVTECAKGWCYVQVPGPDGWMRSDLVYFFDDEDDDGGFVIDKPGKPGQGGGKPGQGGGKPGKPDWGDGKPGKPGQGGGKPGQGGGKPGQGGGKPGQPDWGNGKPGQGGKARACFFEDAGYQGQSFCVNAGKEVANVGWQWNDVISSIRVYGGAEVEVCKNENFGGGCVTVFKDTPNVGSKWNDSITSLSVY